MFMSLKVPSNKRALPVQLAEGGLINSLTCREGLNMRLIRHSLARIEANIFKITLIN